MLKFLLAVLLLANGGLFAYHQGYLSDFFPNAHEPGRAARQVRADQIRLISADVANTGPLIPAAANGDGSADSTAASASAAAVAPASASASAKASASASSAAKAEPVACLEFGEFSLAEAKKFETELAPLALGERQSRHNVQEVNTFVVQIPSQGSKEGADKKASELKGLKIADFYVINDPASPARWSISLGVFKTRAAAQSQLEMLNKQGVRSAIITTRSGNTAKLAFQLRKLPPDVVGKLDAILKDKFAAQSSKPCKVAHQG